MSNAPRNSGQEDTPPIKGRRAIERNEGGLYLLSAQSQEERDLAKSGCGHGQEENVVNDPIAREKDALGSEGVSRDDIDSGGWVRLPEFQHHRGRHDEIAQSPVGGDQECVLAGSFSRKLPEDTNDEPLQIQNREECLPHSVGRDEIRGAFQSRVRKTSRPWMILQR